MKCFKHGAEAVAVCSYCGRAMCAACAGSPAPPRLTCSPECAAGVERDDQAMQMILQKSVQSLKASAFYCYLCAGLSALTAGVAWFMLPLPFLILVAAGSAVVLFVSGVWYSRLANKGLPCSLRKN